MNPFFAPLLFGSDIYRLQVTTFSRLARVGIFMTRSYPPKADHEWTNVTQGGDLQVKIYFR
jgi:hypothetical protein